VKRKSETETVIEYVVNLDAGGYVPSYFMYLYTVLSLRRVTEVQKFFQRLRALEDWDEYYARCVGELICNKRRDERRTSGVLGKRRRWRRAVYAAPE